jgi:hypothetical protein
MFHVKQLLATNTFDRTTLFYEVKMPRRIRALGGVALRFNHCLPIELKRIREVCRRQ